MSSKEQIEDTKVDFDDEEKDDVSVDDTNDEDDVDDEDEDDEEIVADGLTDIGMYNALGNFLTDDEGITIGQSLAMIAKELNKLNHNLKKYVKT
jgi:hypothetical protein